jgi:hypothetical protein
MRTMVEGPRSAVTPPEQREETLRAGRRVARRANPVDVTGFTPMTAAASEAVHSEAA